MALIDTSRRQFFTQLFGAAAPTAAVALYPAASLGLLERFFWKPLKSYFLPAQTEISLESLAALDALFKKVWNERLVGAIPSIVFSATSFDREKGTIDCRADEIFDPVDFLRTRTDRPGLDPIVDLEDSMRGAFELEEARPLDLLLFSRAESPYDFLKQHEPTLDI